MPTRSAWGGHSVGRGGVTATVMVRVMVMALVAAFGAAACSSNGDDSGASRSGSPGSRAGAPTTTVYTGPAADPAYDGPGPNAAGVTTLTAGDRKVEVWYPVDPGAVGATPKDVYHLRDWLTPALASQLPQGVDPAHTTDAYRDLPARARGPYPLLVFSHGFSGWRSQSSFLMTHLAQWGFVVAAPDHRERNLEFFGGIAGTPEVPQSDNATLRAAVVAVRAASAEDGPLHLAVSSERIGVFGQSVGGPAALRFATEPDVAGYATLASAVMSGLDKPSLSLAGTEDGIVPAATTHNSFADALAPAWLVMIEGAGHLNPFTDVCAIAPEQGGIVAIAEDNGLDVPPELERLGTDGCGPGALASDKVWPVTRHYVTAFFRWLLGVDPEPVGFDPATSSGFGPVGVTVEAHEPVGG